jgi:hypothetical protein
MMVSTIGWMSSRGSPNRLILANLGDRLIPYPCKELSMADPTQFFQFEADFVEALRCIPMQVRLKLDTCGIKLSLAQWHQFSPAERQQLVTLDCDGEGAIATYHDHLQALVQHHQGSPAKTLAIDPTPAWHNDQVIPPEVQGQAAQLGYAITQAQWQTLHPLQRFALIKLSRPSHENHNFQAALIEFGLGNGDSSCR